MARAARFRLGAVAPVASIICLAPAAARAATFGANLSRPANGNFDCTVVPLLNFPTGVNSTLQLQGGGAATAAASKKRKTTTYGRARFKVAAGKTAKAKVRLSKKATKLLRSRKKLNVMAVMTLGKGAAAQTVRSPLKLR